jgi:uncharacterized protein YutE (UPF0331/DUF86 family)/predicted nucleotidyltransferase
MRTGEYIDELREYFEKRSDVMMAFVFGSQAKERGHSGSDWDIAVYFTPVSEMLEWEENREYPEEDRIWNDCIDILKTDNVDLVVLNRAPVTVADAAIRGIPLVIKDRALFLRFMLVVSQEAEDYCQFIDEYFAIHQRSESLTPQDRGNLKRIIMFLEEQMSLYPDFRNFTRSEYENNVHQRNDIERWIENIINASIDISKVVLASEKKSVPDTYRDSVKRAAETLGLSQDSVEKFEIWVKLRNILAHEYLDIKWKRIQDFIQNSEPHFRSLVSSVKEFIAKVSENTEPESHSQ